MGKVITLVLGLGLVAGAAYYALRQTAGSNAEAGRSAPARQLDNVRQAADRAEAEAQKRADELGARTAE